VETLEKVSGFAGKHMPIIAVVVAIVALIFPNPIQSSLPARWMSIPLGVVMFSMVTTLKFDDFKIVFQKPKAVIAGICAEYTVMPLLALGLVKLFQLPDDLAVGVILVGCCPGGMASNVMAYLAKGDVALSVGMTACATIISPVVMPGLIMLLLHQTVSMNYLMIFMTIIQVMFIPMALGVMFNLAFPKAAKQLSRVLSLVSVVAISIVIMSVISLDPAGIISAGPIAIAVVALHNVAGYAFGYGVGRVLGLSKKQRRSVSLEVGMKNSGLATAVALANFAAMPAAALPSALFSVWHNISGSIYANALARNSERDGEGEGGEGECPSSRP
jgi:bile acid:Na+ symporter, BASS family